jgi:4-hydroxy-2-oxoglutarate aldolase
MGSIAAKGKAFPPGIHVPSLTWFGNDANQEIDLDTQKKHIEFLVNSGLDGSAYTQNSLQDSTDRR